MQSMIPHPLQQVPLTPVPERLTVWRASTPWQTVRSMVGLVIVCFFIAQLAVVVVAGLLTLALPRWVSGRSAPQAQP